ncbi:unnamed protein product [Lactuca saligna]|uniref:Uncharacterized protein n=1 Tax=Lactuca saligna TaxID=75948 RepID=A0AA35VC78_LACSI|nr:unnamed protein product [Lactuca saligna]
MNIILPEQEGGIAIENVSRDEGSNLEAFVARSCYPSFLEGHCLLKVNFRVFSFDKVFIDKKGVIRQLLYLILPLRRYQDHQMILNNEMIVLQVYPRSFELRVLEEK